jgi:hypothetical protein
MNDKLWQFITICAALFTAYVNYRAYGNDPLFYIVLSGSLACAILGQISMNDNERRKVNYK